MRAYKTGLLLPIFVLAACKTLEHGTVAKVTAPNEARVVLGSQDNAVAGDRVGFYEKHCEYHGASDSSECSDVKVGGGTIMQVLDEHDSIVRADPDVKLGFGAIVKLETAH